MFKNAQIRNILWMFIDKAFLLVGNFIVSVLVARYLGPQNLGYVSYGIALGAIAIAISQWGANYTIFNTGAKNIKRSYKYIMATEKIRSVIYLVIYLIINIILIFFSQYERNTYYLISLVLLSQIFLALDVYQFHYNATLQSKINAKSSILAKLLSMFMRVTFVYFEMNVLYFIIPFFIEGIIIYWKRRSNLAKENIKINKSASYVKHYFNIGLPLVLTGVCVVIYSKINELMLGWLISYKTLGLYSVSFVLNSAWTFVPMSIGISLLSKPIKEKMNSNEQKLGFSFVSIIVFASSIPMLLITYFFADIIIELTFGYEYLESSRILFIMSIASALSVLGFISNRIINLYDGGGRYLMYKTFISSIIFIIMSYFLVKQYEILGAAYGFLLSELFSLTILNYFYQKGLLFKIHIKVFSSHGYYQQYK
jgi:O-antigen/teichoic acid export membrane protein